MRKLARAALLCHNSQCGNNLSLIKSNRYLSYQTDVQTCSEMMLTEDAKFFGPVRLNPYDPFSKYYIIFTFRFLGVDPNKVYSKTC